MPAHHVINTFLLLYSSTVANAFEYPYPPGDPYSDVPYADEFEMENTKPGEWIPTVLDNAVIDIRPKDLIRVTNTNLIPPVNIPAINVLTVDACDQNKLLVRDATYKEYAYFTCEYSGYMNLICLGQGALVHQERIQIGTYFEQPVFSQVANCN